MTFVIDYTYGNLTGKRIRVKNCVNEFDAKCKLHDYLIKKYGSGELEIISCYGEEDVLAMFGLVCGCYGV